MSSSKAKRPTDPTREKKTEKGGFGISWF